MPAESLHLVCPHCHVVNRLPAARLTENPACGQCHRPLLGGQVLELGVDTAEKHIRRNDIPVLIDFWAPWCAPCRMMAPAFAEAAAQERTVRFAKIDTQAEATLGQRFGIRSIPTLILFAGGREIRRQTGAMDAGSIRRWLAQGLG